MDAIGVAVVGFGLGGRLFHAPVIAAVPGLSLRAIVQRSGDSAREEYPGVTLARSVEELLALPGIGLVVITTPNATHFELAKQCLEAGRHVVVDKPFAATSQEARELERIAAAKSVLLSIYQNRRWDGDFLTVRRLLQQRTLGRLVLFESHFDRYRPQRKPATWRERGEPGSGIWFDLGVHLLDQAMLLFGEPQAITADIRAEREGAISDDAFDVLLHYRGMRAWLRSSLLSCGGTLRFWITGEQGSFLKRGLDPQEEALKRGERPAPGLVWGLENEQDYGVLLQPDDQGLVTSQRVPTETGDYRRYYANVRDAIHRRASLEVTPAQALRVLLALEVAVQSSQAGRTLPFG